MSIKIDRNRCVSCGKCIKVCPGNLIYEDDSNKAYIKYPKDCWGCSACLKECGQGAIRYYLGADIGGKGACLYTKRQKDVLEWYLEKANGDKEVITINQKESNKY